MLVVRRALTGAALTVLCLLVGLVTGPPPHSPTRALPADLAPWLRTAADGAWVVVTWVARYPLYVLVAVGVLALPSALAALVRLIPRRIQRDPQRLYTTAQRAHAAGLAGDRCEMETWLFTRCRRPGSAGDHWFPWSKGGATSLRNLVWACTSCNSSKGGKVPTFWQTTRLEWRRRRYFPPGTDIRPGERLSR